MHGTNLSNIGWQKCLMHVAENEACINQKECHNLNIFLALNNSSCIPRPTDRTLIEQLYSVNI